MLITVIRTGGFTGIPFTKTIDTTTLPPDKKKEIESLVSKVSKEPNGTNETKREQVPKPEAGNTSAKPSARWYADRFTYTLSIQNQLTIQKIVFSESSLTPKLRILIQKLETV